MRPHRSPGTPWSLKHKLALVAALIFSAASVCGFIVYLLWGLGQT